MISRGVAALADVLADLDAPEGLYALAARAGALASTDTAAGLLVTAQAFLLLMASVADDALDPREWAAMKRMAASLAKLLRTGDASALDQIAATWRDLRHPAALQ